VKKFILEKKFLNESLGDNLLSDHLVYRGNRFFYFLGVKKWQVGSVE
jgi:hypothetical protein